MYIFFHKNPYSHFTFALLKIFFKSWKFLAVEIQLNLTHSTYWNAGSAPGISNLAESLLLSYALLLHSTTKKEICIWPFLIWVLTTVGPWLSGLDGINSSYCKGPDNQEPTVTKKIVYNPRLLKFFREVLKILMQCATKLVGGVRSPSLCAIGLRQLKSQ